MLNFSCFSKIVEKHPWSGWEVVFSCVDDKMFHRQITNNRLDVELKIFVVCRWNVKTAINTLHFNATKSWILLDMNNKNVRNRLKSDKFVTFFWVTHIASFVNNMLFVKILNSFLDPNFVWFDFKNVLWCIFWTVYDVAGATNP